MYQYKSKLPADPTSLILGIIALVIGIAGCCCYGITAIIPLGLSIGGLVMANKSLREYRQNPDTYSQSSYSAVNTARVINIIAVILNAITLVFFLIVFAIYGTFVSTAILEGIRQDQLRNDYDYSDDGYQYDEYDDGTYEWENDSTTIEVEEVKPTTEIDSVNIDAI